MEHRPELFLEAAIPYAGRLKTKNQQFQKLLRACKGVKVVCQEYAPHALCSATVTWPGSPSG